MQYLPNTYIHTYCKTDEQKNVLKTDGILLKKQLIRLKYTRIADIQLY